MAAFFAAARTGDRNALRATTSQRDPTFDDRARLLSTNLSTLPLTRLDVTVGKETLPVDPARAEVLGSGAWTQSVTLRWQLRGEEATAEHRVWLTLVVDHGVRVAGANEPPPGVARAPQPIWWRGPVTAAAAEGVLVLLGSGQPAGRWTARATDALRQVRHHVPSGVDRLDADLVIEVPASPADFEAVVGVTPGSYGQVAAATVGEGPRPDAAVHVVANPAAERRLSDVGLAVVLTHETVHAVTRSPGSPAPTWAVEGLADYVALRAYPEARAGVFAPLRAQVRSSGGPVALPTESAFAAEAPEVAVAYASAWSFAQFLADTYGAPRLGRLYTTLDRGTSLAQAARPVLGVSERTLLDAWRRDLSRRAAR